MFKNACALGCEGIVSKRLGSTYRSGRSQHCLKIKNPTAPAVKREAEEIGCDNAYSCGLVSPLSGLGGFPAGNGAASSRSFSS